MFKTLGRRKEKEERERGEGGSIQKLLVFKVIHYKFKPVVRMQSKNTITIVHVMASMCGMYKIYVHYLEYRCWTHVGV